MATSIVRSTFNSVGRDQTNIYSNFDPDQERRNITEWLSKLNFSATQSDFFDRSEKGTGNWLLESETFQNWRNEMSQILWCPGNPGAGKTILASIIVNHLQTVFKDCNVGITCIYCNYKEQMLQTATNLIASLLKQLVQKSQAVPDHIMKFYRSHQDTSTFPTLGEFTTALNTEIKRYKKVFIVVDGSDECSESDGSRVKLLRALRSLAGPVNIMVTSRELSSIEQHFREALRIYIRATDGDVEKFIRSQLVDYPDLIRLREIITPKIVQNVRGMFLLARLQVNMLTQQHSEKGIINALDNLPSGIDDIYDQTMDRIERQPQADRELAKRVLSWIIYARRPLTVEELRHAFAVSPGMTRIDRRALVFDSKLTSVCAGLVVIDGQRTIRLAHYTTQQYFENQRNTRFPNAEADIAATCLRYLSLNTFTRGYCQSDDEFDSLLGDNPFVDYAATNWGHHACPHQESVKDLAINFLRDDSKVACASQVILARREGRNQSQYFPKNRSAVHIAAFFNLDQIVEYQLANGANPNLADNCGRTPLLLATLAGNQETVVTLVARDEVYADWMDKAERTCLSYVADYGLEDVVKLLVARDDVDANATDRCGRTPLSYAASSGREGVMKLLLARDIDANSKDSNGETPLSHAVRCGCEGVVKLLLTRDDIDVDSKDLNGRTPLSYAAECGDKAIMSLLVARDADIRSVDRCGRTPVSYALWAVRDLLVEGINRKTKLTY